MNKSIGTKTMEGMDPINSKLAQDKARDDAVNREAIMAKGIFFLILGVVALMVVYYFRPPSGFGDALMMLGRGRDVCLNEPVYLIFMLLSAGISVLGLSLIIKAKNKTACKTGN